MKYPLLGNCRFPDCSYGMTCRQFVLGFRVGLVFSHCWCCERSRGSRHTVPRRHAPYVIETQRGSCCHPDAATSKLPLHCRLLKPLANLRFPFRRGRYGTRNNPPRLANICWDESNPSIKARLSWRTMHSLSSRIPIPSTEEESHRQRLAAHRLSSVLDVLRQASAHGIAAEPKCQHSEANPALRPGVQAAHLEEDNHRREEKTPLFDRTSLKVWLRFLSEIPIMPVCQLAAQNWRQKKSGHRPAAQVIPGSRSAFHGHLEPGNKRFARIP